MDKVKISVVIASYNGAEFLVEQLESIRNQTMPPDELIICDDRSKDKENYHLQQQIFLFFITKNKNIMGLLMNIIWGMQIILIMLLKWQGGN